MDEIAAYIAFSGAIGLLQVRDTYNLLKQEGDDEAVIDHSFSILEFLWFFVSVAILVATDLTKLEIIIPLLFIAYNVFGWVYGAQAIRKAENDGMDDVILSSEYIRASMIFSLCFSAYVWFVLYMHYVF